MYKEADVLDLQVGELWSKKSSITYDYYDLPWCNKKENFSSTETENEAVGLSLREDETQASPYEVSHQKLNAQRLTLARFVLVHIRCRQTPFDPLPEGVQLRGGVEV